MEIGLFKNARSAIARRWGHRGHFASTRDWLVSLYDTLLRYAKGSPLPWQGRTCAVTIAGDHHPVYLRLGSSDGFVLEEIFIAEVYGREGDRRRTRSSQLPSLLPQSRRRIRPAGAAGASLRGCQAGAGLSGPIG
jgi:hypothetical protein